MSTDTSATLFSIQLLVVLYALSYQLQSPLEPFLVDRLVKGGDASVDAAPAYALLQSFFGAVQMLGSLLVGGLIDRLGVRVMLGVNFLACAATYGLLALAADWSSLTLLFASKLPTVFMAGFLCAQSAVCALTPPGPDRVAQLGRLTLSYTIGGAIGPALGGQLGTPVAARLAVVASLAAACLVLTLPAGLEAGRAEASAKEAGSSSSSSSKRSSSSSSSRAAAPTPPPASSWLATAGSVLTLAWPLVATKALGGLVNAANGSVRTLALKDVFGLSQAELGLVMSSIFAGTSLASLCLGWLSKAMGSEAALARACMGGAAAAYAAQAALFAAAAPSSSSPSDLGLLRGAYVALTLALALCTFPLSTTLTAMSTARVPGGARGTLVGIEHSLFAVANMVGPPVGVALQGSAGVGGVAAAAAAVYAGILLCWQGVGVRGAGGQPTGTEAEALVPGEPEAAQEPEAAAAKVPAASEGSKARRSASAGSQSSRRARGHTNQR